MSGWTRHDGIAAALDMENVDTDQIIPARFMSTPRSEGYGRFLFHDLRRGADGAPRADFPLNQAPDATVLVTGRNFGSGSSREAAVYALVDAGLRAVIAPSFGDIFASNAVNNGLLPAEVAEIDALLDRAKGGRGRVVIDIEAGVVEIDGLTVAFTLDPIWREKLKNGWDDIDMTAKHADAIRAFRDARAAAQPWTFPQGRGAAQ